MGEIFFVIKCFLGSLLILWGLQYKIGQETLEQRAQQWVRSSQLSHQIREVGLTGVDLAEIGYIKSKRWLLSVLQDNGGPTK